MRTAITSFTCPGAASAQMRATHFAHDRHREHRRRSDARNVSAHDARAVPLRNGLRPLIKFKQPRFLGSGRNAQTNRRQTGRRAHRRDIA